MLTMHLGEVHNTGEFSWLWQCINILWCTYQRATVAWKVQATHWRHRHLSNSLHAAWWSMKMPFFGHRHQQRTATVAWLAAGGVSRSVASSSARQIRHVLYI